MAYASGDAGRILESCIDGFHRYRLEAPAHPDYVSESLCAMIGCTADEIRTVDHFFNDYASMKGLLLLRKEET